MCVCVCVCRERERETEREFIFCLNCLQEQELQDLVNSPDDMEGVSSPLTPSSPSKEPAQL